MLLQNKKISKQHPGMCKDMYKPQEERKKSFRYTQQGWKFCWNSVSEGIHGQTGEGPGESNKDLLNLKKTTCEERLLW